MLDFLFNTATDSQLTITSAVITIAVALVLGVIISFTYMKTTRKGTHSQNFVLTLVMIPAIIAIIILLVGSNVARAFSLAGAFSIIRFRSAPGDPKDITYIFFTLAAGLACGVGLYGYAALFALVLCLAMFLLQALKFGRVKSENKTLKITIPEDLNDTGAFDDILLNYAESFQLRQVKTVNLGTLYELVYDVVIKNDVSEKELMDLLRCRNGNLSISLLLAADAPSMV